MAKLNHSVREPPYSFLISKNSKFINLLITKTMKTKCRNNKWSIYDLSQEQYQIISRCVNIVRSSIADDDDDVMSLSEEDVIAIKSIDFNNNETMSKKLL